MVERALESLQEKAMAFCESSVRAEAINMACDIRNVCTATSYEDGMSRFQKWSGKSINIKALQSLGTVERFRTGNRTEKLDPCGIKCVVRDRDR